MPEALRVAEALDVHYSVKVHSRRPPKQVLLGTTLTAQAGELVAVVGPSGCGKTTLLRLFAGYEIATAGSIRILGTDVASMRPRRRVLLQRDKIGFITQSFDVIPSLSVFDNVALPARLARRRWDRQRIHDAVETVGLTSHSRRRPGELSGGERQRIAIARVLARAPELILADEPTSALDHDNAVQAISALRTLTDAGSATIVVTHDPQVAATADRVLVMRSGRVQQELGRSNPAEVLQAMAWSRTPETHRT